MIEKNLDLKKLGRKRKTSATILSQEEIVSGLEEKYRVSIQLGNRELFLVRKKIRSDMAPKIHGFDNLSNTPAERFCQAWELLKERGLPVIETIRIANDSEIYMSDLTVGGKVVYSGKHDLLDFYLDGRLQQPTDKFFREFSDYCLRLLHEAMKIAKIATEQGILLAWDDPLQMVVDQEGNWSLIVLDISQIEIWKNPEDAPRDLKESNEKLIQWWYETQIDFFQELFSK